MYVTRSRDELFTQVTPKGPTPLDFSNGKLWRSIWNENQSWNLQTDVWLMAWWVQHRASPMETKKLLSPRVVVESFFGLLLFLQLLSCCCCCCLSWFQILWMGKWPRTNKWNCFCWECYALCFWFSSCQLRIFQVEDCSSQSFKWNEWIPRCHFPISISEKKRISLDFRA